MKWMERGSVSLKGEEEGEEGGGRGNRRRVVKKGSKIFEESGDNHTHTQREVVREGGGNEVRRKGKGKEGG